MTQDWVPWAFFVAGMFSVFSVVYYRTASFRKSFIFALLVGKSFAIVYALAGLDRPVAALYFIHRSGCCYRVVYITMIELLFLGLLASLLATLAWPVLAKKAPRELRELVE